METIKIIELDAIRDAVGKKGLRFYAVQVDDDLDADKWHLYAELGSKKAKRVVVTQRGTVRVFSALYAIRLAREYSDQGVVFDGQA